MTSHDAPNVRKATVPESPSFAELVRNCEEHLKNARSPVALIGNENLRDLVACVREQQAALRVALIINHAEECGSLDDGACDCGIEHHNKLINAVLAKWEIKP